MVINRGLVAISAEIKKRINAIVPSAYSTDTFVEIDKEMRDGENDLPVDQWRRYYVSMQDLDKGQFDGNYVYSQKDIGVSIHLFYSESGANRVIGTPDVDFDALALQDVDDVERALRGHIITDDGCSARLLFNRSSVTSDGIEAEIIIDFTMPVFLRGEAAIQDLFIGPNMMHTLNGGDKFYLVLRSDLACEVTVSSSPAGCVHLGSVMLGTGVPTVLEVTCTTANTYTFSVTSENGGSDTCEVQVYPASDFVLVGPDQAIPNDIWSVNLAVAASNNGIFPVTGSANLTLPETVTIVSNKGVIPVTITERGSHSVVVGGDTCTFTSVTPETKIPYYNNQYYQIDPVYNAGTGSGIFSGGAGDYAIVQTPDDNGDLFFTFAYRYKPIQNTSASGSLFAYIGAGSATNYSNWAVVNYTYLQRPSLHFRNYENTTNRAYYVTSLQTFNNWHDVVITYQYNVNTQTGILYIWTDGAQNPVGGAALGALDRIGLVYNEAMTKTKTFQMMPSGIGRFEFYDIYISNNYAWDSDDVSAFVAKSAIDPDHYTLYWPLQKNTDLPYLVDYDRKNNVPLYIPGPHPEIEWIPKP